MPTDGARSRLVCPLLAILLTLVLTLGLLMDAANSASGSRSALEALMRADPASNGEFSHQLYQTNIKATQNATLLTSIYLPSAASAAAATSASSSPSSSKQQPQQWPSIARAAKPCPLIVLAHGFMQSSSEHRRQGELLATRGYITIIPDLRGGSDHQRNADDLRALIDWALSENTREGSPFYRAIDRAKIGLTGHSAGGLSVLLAAAADERIEAIAPMDPVDYKGMGVAAGGKVRCPTAVTFSEPSSCNRYGSANKLYTSLSAPKRGVKVVGATHTDGQDPSSLLARMLCGTADPMKQMLYRRYTIGWFDYHLKRAPGVTPYVFNLTHGPLANDLRANRITYEADYTLPIKRRGRRFRSKVREQRDRQDDDVWEGRERERAAQVQTGKVVAQTLVQYM
ncbi:unnamed protein product [Vitrella brassicaformis CCMP3155]|uniref:PET hydrolase/cutinase-like domain-containing protein n=2 Tax=Vitrella brassicaformis TaxID=1169539 RepID=A0A0G4E991_VITBC|nr:unnamed protein product [Vitrella brassicaformis CCMP3155]|eukprot:CEL91802.1 unnamed protein product [Vitrella brassicaformis CCMP3155]